MSDVNLRVFQADDAPWLVEQHGVHYARDEGFDDSFSPLVASILDGFVAAHDPVRERGSIAERNGERLGSVFCVSAGKAGDETAKLRLFLLTPAARGHGLGKRLLRACMDFAKEAGYRDMALWTHESHRAACALYTSFGWEHVESTPVHSFGVDLVEQSWRVDL
jgi:GNAT superfamily N-acetyltransferase